MNFYYLTNRMIYCLSNDKNIEKIEDILQCQLTGKGRYFGKYISYLALGSVNVDKIQELEYTLKRHVSVVRHDYNFIIKVYHRHCKLPLYAEYTAYKTKDLILGIGYDGVVKIPINTETNNYLICGCSSSGKSTLAISIIQGLIENNVDCLVVDNKQSNDYDNLNCPVFKGINACLYQLQKFNHEIDNLLSKGKTHKKLLVIDEIYPFLLLSSKEKKEAYNLLGLIMSKCRACDYHCMILTQRPTTDIIDAKIITHCSYRICFQTSSKQESLNVLNTNIAYDIDIKGRAYLSINGRLQEFQSYYYKPPKKVVKEIEVESVKSESVNNSKFL